jgi:solute carrier family 45 protein 1/2/4
MTGFSLPLPDESQTAHGSPRLTGAAYILGPPWSNLPVITIGLLGYQIFWSVEMSYGKVCINAGWTAFDSRLQASPYLLSLGLNKALMAMVFVAGPLSGLIVQPVIGTSKSVRLADFSLT